MIEEYSIPIDLSIDVSDYITIDKLEPKQLFIDDEIEEPEYTTPIKKQEQLITGQLKPIKLFGDEITTEKGPKLITYSYGPLSVTSYDTSLLGNEMLDYMLPYFSKKKKLTSETVESGKPSIFDTAKKLFTSPFSFAGGSNSSQFYIEYFMKNPHKMKKEDKNNIRNILKHEDFDNELAHFIKDHLKL
jgi:hypothetical protein